MGPGSIFPLEVRARLPNELARLEELANNLYYGWDQSTQELFKALDESQWESSLHNPKVLLRHIEQARLDHAATDRAFLERYHDTLSRFDRYMQQRPAAPLHEFDAEADCVAYFCAEFGFHESLPIYSGGLGILAADYCKAASDLFIPFVAVGLLYRQGNLTQQIDSNGNQVYTYLSIDVDDLPLAPAKDNAGNDLYVTVELPQGTVKVRIWLGRAGHIRIVLLDTEVDGNVLGDRSITHQIYPGDSKIRLEQAMILGIGGVRALAALGITPRIYHVNEGLPALQVIERCRELVATGLTFDVALEAVATATVFTTHTPVPAGHEIVDLNLFTHFLGQSIRDLGIDPGQFLAICQTGHQEGVNLTTLSLKTSRFHNGVSQIHGGVAASIEHHVWPEIEVEESPITYVTNGVHAPTFLAREWTRAFPDENWSSRLSGHEYAEHILDINDNAFFEIHRSLKRKLLADVRQRIQVRWRRLGESQFETRRRLAELDNAEQALVIGFARRFATYKRATLIFKDIERLRRLVEDDERPVIFIFAGKAHQADTPGQDLIREVHYHAEQPEFRGKILLLEGYGLALSRLLVTGCDIWLNLPEYPLEACGTSGQKAGMNGVPNLSILDGWWPEAYDGENGWGIEPCLTPQDHGHRDDLEAQALFDLLEDEVVPSYFDRTDGLPAQWISMAKRSMATILPRFNAERMLSDYIKKLYVPSTVITEELSANNFTGALELSNWKRRVSRAFPAVSIVCEMPPPEKIESGGDIRIEVDVNLGDLSPDDVIVECLLGTMQSDETFTAVACFRLAFEAGSRFAANFVPPLPGKQYYRLRVYPYHNLLSNPFELGLMKWL